MDKHGKSGNSRGRLRVIIGNVLMSLAGGLAIFFAACLFLGMDGFPWWASVIGLALCVPLARWGGRVRIRPLRVDPETDRAGKND